MPERPAPGSVSPLGIPRDGNGAAEAITGDDAQDGGGGYPDAGTTPDRGSSAPRDDEEDKHDVG